MSLAAIVAIIIFLVMFVMVVTEKIEKHYVTMGCGALMLIVVFGLIRYLQGRRLLIR